MKKNMNGIDRIVRLVVAIIIAVLFFTKVLTGIPGIVLLIVAGIFLLTSLVSVCPLYMLFGLSTRSDKK